MNSASPVEAFWSRYVTRAGTYPRRAGEVREALSILPVSAPPLLVELTTLGTVTRVDAPRFRVGAVGDWLAHALERYRVMVALADVHANPTLAAMLPIGDTGHGFEVAVELGRTTARVLWLDPTRYDCGSDAIAAVDAESIEAFVRHRLESGADLGIT